MQGVESVQVSLNEGLARIQLKPGNKIKLAQLQKRVEESGFVPKQARVTVAVRIDSVRDSLRLVVVGTEEVFRLSLAPESPLSKDELRKRVGNPLSVEGVIKPSPNKGAYQNFELISFKEPEKN